MIMGFLTLQTQEDILKISEQDLAGIKIEDARVFNGNALWGYINGGADIYLEYGFDVLHAQKVEYEDRKYIVDMYKMNDLESAYGIYSVSHSNCEEKLKNENYSCVMPYQVQFVKGSYYISIINENGTAEEQSVCKSFAEILGNKIEESSYSFPALLLKDELLSFQENTKLLKGRLGLENGFPMWASQFENLENFKIIVMPTETGDDMAYIGVLEFPDSKVMSGFLGNIHIDPDKIKESPALIEKSKIYVKYFDDNSLLLIESLGDLSLIDKYIEILDLE